MWKADTNSFLIREVCINFEFACQRVSHDEFRLAFIPFDEINAFFFNLWYFFQLKCVKMQKIWLNLIFHPRGGCQICRLPPESWQLISMYIFIVWRLLNRMSFSAKRTCQWLSCYACFIQNGHHVQVGKMKNEKYWIKNYQVAVILFPLERTWNVTDILLIWSQYWL